MRSRAELGEFALAALFACTGIAWIVGALVLPLWQGFAPSTGFLPLIYGCLLLVLAVISAISLFRKGAGATEQPPVGKPLVLLLALAAAVVGMSSAGFGLAIFLMLLFMFAVVERRPLSMSLLVAAGNTAVLILIFAMWLAVPLPKGPWGF